MDKWVIVRPIWDDITIYSCKWAEEIANILKERGALVADLAERPVSREELERILREHPEACVGFWDHGSENCLWGGEGEKVLDLNNCELLANKEVFTLACLSAAKLGVEVWRKGGKYWGYIKEFSFTTDSLPEFQEASNCGFYFRHVEGDTAENALARAKAKFSELALQLANSGKVLAAVCMRNDGDILRYYNGEAPGEGKGCLTALLGLEIGRKLLRAKLKVGEGG